MDNQEAFVKAEEHWKSLKEWLHMAFVDAFVHERGHVEEETRDKVQQP